MSSRRVLRAARRWLDHPRRRRRAQAKGVLERSHRFMRTNFEHGRRFTNQLDFQSQLDGWCDRVNGRMHRTVRAVPGERLLEEQERVRPLPERLPDLDCRFVIRALPSSPMFRVDRCDYSLDPASRWPSRRGARVAEREVLAGARLYAGDGAGDAEGAGVSSAGGWTARGSSPVNWTRPWLTRFWLRGVRVVIAGRRALGSCASS